MTLANFQMSFEEAEVLECKTEEEDVEEEIYAYQNEDGDTIVLPAGTDIKQIIGEGNQTMRLVQISLPSDSSGDSRNWLSLVQNS